MALISPLIAPFLWQQPMGLCETKQPINKKLSRIV